MVSRSFRKKRNATRAAKRARRMGLKASVFKKKKGYAVSVTRK